MNRENRENGHTQNPCHGKEGIWKFTKTQNIWFAQVVNSRILKIKDISIFAVKISPKKFEAGLVIQVSFVYVIVTNHVNWDRNNLLSDRENTGNLKMSGYPALEKQPKVVFT